jgi:hypothetical protein
MSTRSAATDPPPAASFPRVLKRVLGSVTPTVQHDFVATVVGDDEGGLDDSLWGRGPSAEDRREAALVNLRRQYVARRQVIDASLTRPEVAGLLDLSEQAVLDRLEAGDLVGLKKGREWRLPAWQLSPDSERGFVPGLRLLRASFPGGVVSLTEWATEPNVELDGATPADALGKGEVEAVVRAAHASSSAAW